MQFELVGQVEVVGGEWVVDLEAVTRHHVGGRGEGVGVGCHVSGLLGARELVGERGAEQVAAFRRSRGLRCLGPLLLRRAG